MVDYCPTEIAAILLVFQDPNIRFFHWHMVHALANKFKDRIPLPNFGATLSVQERYYQRDLIQSSAGSEFN